jgi:hypothetical protein
MKPNWASAVDPAMPINPRSRLRAPTSGTIACTRANISAKTSAKWPISAIIFPSGGVHFRTDTPMVPLLAHVCKQQLAQCHEGNTPMSCIVNKSACHSSSRDREIEGYLSHLNGKVGGPIEQMIEGWILIQPLSTAAPAMEASHDDAVDARRASTNGATLVANLRILRALAILDMIFDTHKEANQIAREAHWRYPFAEW